MRYRQREERVRGESPFLKVDVRGDGTEAQVQVQYARTSVSKDVKTTTFGVLDLGNLGPADLACVGRTIARALTEMQAKHENYLDAEMQSVRSMLS